LAVSSSIGGGGFLAFNILQLFLRGSLFLGLFGDYVVELPLFDSGLFSGLFGLFLLLFEYLNHFLL
jgi:hypothetical protein